MMNKSDWIEERARQIEREMPDEYPTGYARYLAEREWELGAENA